MTYVVCFSHLNYEQAVHLSETVWYICGLLCAVFGIPGHIFQGLIMLNKSNRKEPISFYLVAIVACEFLYLISALWIRLVLMSGIRFDPRLIFSCGILYAITVGPTIASNLLLASLSIDRSIIVIYPTRYRILVTRSHVFKRIFSIIFVVILVMIPLHFSFYSEPNSYDKFLCELHSTVRRWEVNLWPLIHTIIFALVPSLITCVSCLILCHNRFKKRRASFRCRRMQRLSLLLAIFSISGLVAILPVCILEVFIFNDRIIGLNIICSIKRIRYTILLNYFLSLMIMNYSFKFYIRLIISTPFRRDFIRLISCNWFKNHNQHSFRK